MSDIRRSMERVFRRYNNTLRKLAQMEREEQKKYMTLKADGFDSCVIALGSRIDNNVPIFVYDYDKCAKVLVDRDGMSLDEAYEFMEVNVVGAWHGEGTPIFVRTVDSIAEAEAMLSDLAETEGDSGEDGLDTQVVS